MSEQLPFRDALNRFAQLGTYSGVQLVRVLANVGGNRYSAQPITVNSGGQVLAASGAALTVMNLEEVASSTGRLPSGTQAVTLDVEGQWIIFVSQDGVATVVARVVAAITGGAYTVREQVMTAPSAFADKPGSTNVTALNLAELSLGAAAAVEAGAIVLVTMLPQDTNPPSVAYVFDHPAYAGYVH